MYELRLSREAEKIRWIEFIEILKRLPTDRKEQIKRVLEEMRQTPFSGDVKPLRGTASGSYRRRIGALRIVFQLDQQVHVIWIETLGFRGDVYK